VTTTLLQGSDAISGAAIAAGCRFFAGYPMLPFTHLLESFAKHMPEVSGTCMNAASENEAANMALGAAAAGARAGTGSCGQGIALMQETVAEAALCQLPMVFFLMARGQQDYFQATRGGGWGDYRTPTLAPKNVQEAADFTQDLFYLADKYRTPTILYGDYLISDMQVSVDVEARTYEPLPAKDWALDGSLGGSRRSRSIWSWDKGKVGALGDDPDKHWRKVAAKYDEIAAAEARHESRFADQADFLVVSFGTSAAFVDYVVDELRAEGVPVGSFRPITLWPFPEQALHEAAAGKRSVMVFEANAGQMLDDVRLSVRDSAPIDRIGGVSVDHSGMRQGELLNVKPIRERILNTIAERT
jgi:2-oxoglutarate/2-oxoacid ferredoxin oxidoreductase subunit alpha